MKLNKIIFNNNKFDGLICLNGNIPNRDFFENLEGVTIIAADGAADYLHRANIIPNYIVGDMDSINPSTLQFFFERTNLFQLSDQETNDFEKAVLFALSLNLNNLLIVGINGGLYEHSLNNWSVLAKLSRITNLCVLDDNRYAFSISKSTEINLSKGEIVSIIPQTKVKLITKNLKWNLDSEVLEIGEREGARNIAISDNIVLEVVEGEALIFVDSRFPFAPESLN